jgi:hypothetical protein
VGCCHGDRFMMIYGRFVDARKSWRIHVLFAFRQ